MKILVISAAFPPLRAGEADHALHLCQRLADRGLDINVLTGKRHLVTNRFPFKVYPIMRHWLWPDLPRLAMFLRRCSPDAILLIYSDRDYDRHPMITFVPGISKAFLPAVPFVTQLETEYVSRQVSLPTKAILKMMARLAGPKHLDYVFGTLLLKSDRIIVLSERHLASLSMGCTDLEGKSVVIPPPPIMHLCPENDGLSRQQGREALGVKPEEFLVAYYGYIYEEKGVEILLQAFQTFNSKRSNTRLVMIGGSSGETHSSCYLNGIHELAKQLGVWNNIIWTGEYTSDSHEASLYLHAADVGVFPFNYGVTLNRSSVAAAAVHGLPIITTQGAALESPFRDQENVLLCPPRNPAALAFAMDALMTNPQLCHRLRAGSRQLAQQCFSWEKTVERTIEAMTA
jgi:glycosyltransferase involved in cell wall biosynthesis